MTEFLINNSEDRKNVIAAFANAGYKVSVVERQNEKYRSTKDYFVQVEELEEADVTQRSPHIHVYNESEFDVQEIVNKIEERLLKNSNPFMVKKSH